VQVRDIFDCHYRRESAVARTVSLTSWFGVNVLTGLTSSNMINTARKMIIMITELIPGMVFCSFWLCPFLIAAIQVTLCQYEPIG
jgi:hypothetical protein